jgi:hypothetical protein
VGAIVEADLKSFGIFCMESEAAAEKYLRIYSETVIKSSIIVKVWGIGRLEPPAQILSGSWVALAEEFENFFHRAMHGWSNYSYMSTPRRTLCFRKVEVLT